MMKNFFRLVLISLVACSCQGGGGEDKTPEPYIQSIITDYDGKVVVGKPVTLTGLNFSPVASENKVLYGIGLDAVSLAVNESSEETIVFTAPQVTSTQLKVRVSTRGKESNQVTLEYIDEPPVEEPWSDVPTLDFAKLGGTVRTIAPGVEWTTFHGNWEGQMRNINIVRTTLNEHNHLGIYNDGLGTNVLEKCEAIDALLGTNGPMACCHFVRVDGVTKRGPRENSVDEYFIYNCALTIDDNVPDIVILKSATRDNYNQSAVKLPNKTVGVAGPLLVYDGKIQVYPEDGTAAFLNSTHPRTAIGISKDQKTVIQVTVDGRYDSSDASKRAIGMTTPLLSKLMLGLGCYKAMNFDGGGGTAMYIKGYGDQGVVNHPCDNRLWDEPFKCLRPSGNTVYIKTDL